MSTLLYKKINHPLVLFLFSSIPIFKIDKKMKCIHPNFYSASNLELDFSKNSQLVLLNLLLKKKAEKFVIRASSRLSVPSDRGRVQLFYNSGTDFALHADLP